MKFDGSSSQREKYAGSNDQKGSRGETVSKELEEGTRNTTERREQNRENRRRWSREGAGGKIGRGRKEGNDSNRSCRSIYFFSYFCHYPPPGPCCCRSSHYFLPSIFILLGEAKSCHFCFGVHGRLRCVPLSRHSPTITFSLAPYAFRMAFHLFDGLLLTQSLRGLLPKV
jgi:hypothetical protein